MGRQPAALVGRSGELAGLSEAVGVPRDVHGLAILSGDAGIGKTRLLRDLLANAEAGGVTVAVGHCAGQAGAGVPYLPFTEVLAILWSQVPDQVAQAAARHPALGLLLPAAEHPEAAMMGVTGPGRLAEAVHDCLVTVARTRPLLVVFEDVHWADDSSRDVLTLLLTRGFDAPIGMIVSYRSDDLHRRHPLQPTLAVWARLPEVARFHLGPLPDPAMRELVRALKPADEDTVAAIAARAGGNAFFAEELVASGAAVGPDLTRVLQSRFEQLDAPAQRVVRVIAVAGATIRHDLLASVSGLDGEELDAALRTALDHQTLELVPPDGYGFRHALLAEAVLDDMLPGERTRVHRAFAETLTSHPEWAKASQRARHAAASGDIPGAVLASLQAGASAFTMGGYREALRLYETALGWLDDTDERRSEITVLAARAASAAGDAHRAAALLDDRIRHSAPEAPGRSGLLSAYVMLARLAYDEVPDARERAEEAVRLTEGERGRARAEALTALVQALADLELDAEAGDVSEEALFLAEAVDAEDLVTELRTILLSLEGDAIALELEETLLATVRSGSMPGPTLVRAYHRLGAIAQSRGELEKARMRFTAGAAMATQINRPWGPFESACAVRAAAISYELGDWDAALAQLDLPGPPYPQPGYAIQQAHRLLVLTARQLVVEPGLFEQAKPYWTMDPYVAVVSVAPQVELLGREHDLATAIELLAEAVALIDRQWSPREQATIRLAAVLIGVLADHAATADETARRGYLALADAYVLRAEQSATDAQHPPGVESRAWLCRLAAERLRLSWRAARPVSLDDLRVAWQASVEAFDTYGHRYEGTRSRARLAEVLAAAGDLGSAQDLLDIVRDVADRLGSEPVRAMIAAITPRARATSGEELTVRERDVLTLLALGRSNGQIGDQLFISVKTASVHVSHILAKLGARTRGEAVALAREQGLL
ncbi:MAG TPA: AAA family ATPase [Propionicimonas sp.]|uniref:helix-turn-helix transcriptional regulator n=1 Tax=Propionicimonas sp. TaxID=1955623 RepID=UPI002F3EEB8A